MASDIIRCEWANNSELYQQYHDKEWGVPVHEDLKLFQMLILEGKQAGLSWLTILNRRPSLCEAFDNFDPHILINYDENKISELLSNSGIIRNKLKVNAAISNAKAYFKLCEQHGSLDKFLWEYVDNKPIINHWSELGQVPNNTEISDAISKDLKKLGFKFVGSTIIYAFMQSVGMVNDHISSCFCYKGIE